MWMSYFFHNRLLLNARLPLIGQKLKRAGKIMYRWTFDSPFLYWASEPPLFTKKHRMGMQPTWAFTRMWFLARGKLSHDGVCKPERTLESELALLSFIGYSMRAHARSDRTLSFLEILGLGALADWADTPLLRRVKVDLSYQEGCRNPQVESVPYLAFSSFCSISKKNFS